MRIAIVTHAVCCGDGQGRVNYEIARAALDRGHTIVLLSTQVDADMAARDSVSWIQIPVAAIPTQFLRNLVFAAWSTFYLLTNTSYDIILSNGAITWAASNVNAVHFVHSAWLKSPVHTSRLDTGATALYQWFYTICNAWLERRALSCTDTIVAVSSRVRDELIEIGVNAGSIRIVPNGVDLEEFFPGPVSRSQLGLPAKVPLALFVGDLQTPRKNLDTVLQALVHVPDLHLAVAGSLEGSPYPALADSLGLDSRVHFLGFRRDVATLMRTADICVCPSRYEPFSLVALEAMASGCPVLTTQQVGAADLIPADAGYVLKDTEDADRMAAVLSRFLSDPEQCSAMAKAARRTALAYPWERTALGYLQILEQCHSTAETVTSMS
jgi:glycosyltransferase involved in cell wall biosynthesis